MLTKEQLKQLRQEITLNSLFLKDYRNSLGISEKACIDFFDGYIEYLNEIRDEKEGFHLNDIFSFTDMLEKYDNIDNLWIYYIMFTDDPLKITDDIIKELFIEYTKDYKEINIYSYYSDFDNIEYMLFNTHKNKYGILEKELITRDHFYDIITDGYIEYCDDEIDRYIDNFIKHLTDNNLIDGYIKNYIENSYDIYSLRELVYEYVSINYPYDDYLRQDIKVNLFYKNSNWLVFLLHTQGYYIKDHKYLRKILNSEKLTKSDIKQYKKDRKNSKFLSSLIDEIENAFIEQYNELCFIASITIDDYFKIKENNIIFTIKKDAYSGLVDRYNGGGSILNIQLEKDININSRDIIIYVEKINKYTVDDIYGLVSSCFKNCIEVRSI